MRNDLEVKPTVNMQEDKIAQEVQTDKNSLDISKLLYFFLRSSTALQLS